jgi:hypothetical protein
MAVAYWVEQMDKDVKTIEDDHRQPDMLAPRLKYTSSGPLVGLRFTYPLVSPPLLLSEVGLTPDGLDPPLPI